MLQLKRFIVVLFFLLDRRSDSAGVRCSRPRSKGRIGVAVSLCALLVRRLALPVLSALLPSRLLGLGHYLLRRRRIPHYALGVLNFVRVNDFPGKVPFNVDGVLRALLDHKRRLLFFGEQKLGDAA